MTTEQRLEAVEGQLTRLRWLNNCLVTGMLLCLVLCIFLSLGGWFILKTYRSQTARTVSKAEEARPKTQGQSNQGHLLSEVGVEDLKSRLRLLELKQDEHEGKARDLERRLGLLAAEQGTKDLQERLDIIEPQVRILWARVYPVLNKLQ